MGDGPGWARIVSALTGMKSFFHFDSNEYFKQHLCCHYFAKKCNAAVEIVSFYLKRVITDYPINLNYGKT